MALPRISKPLYDLLRSRHDHVQILDTMPADTFIYEGPEGAVVLRSLTREYRFIIGVIFPAPEALHLAVQALAALPEGIQELEAEAVVQMVLRDTDFSALVSDNYLRVIYPAGLPWYAECVWRWPGSYEWSIGHGLWGLYLDNCPTPHFGWVLQTDNGFQAVTPDGPRREVDGFASLDQACWWLWREWKRRGGADKPWLDAQIGAARDAGLDAAKVAAATSVRQKILDRWLTEEERIRCRELRKSAMWGSAVRAALGCTGAELDRWDRDGRLPHAFKRAGSERHFGRKWLVPDVERAKTRLIDWRKQDADQLCWRRKFGSQKAKGKIKAKLKMGA
jgi:hypothetical protein